jgi:hypothetical protein
MKALFTFTLALILFAAQASYIAYSLNDRWRVYSSPDNSFSAELPAPLREVMSFSGEHNASLDPDQKSGWCPCYAAIETTPEDSRFGVIVINARQKILRSQARDEKYGLYWYLGAVLIGNEDEAEPTSVKEIHVNGLKGKEYIYTRGGVSTRGRIFETGGKIYVVVFVGKDDADLTSSDAERFLNSFRLRGRNQK